MFGLFKKSQKFNSPEDKLFHKVKDQIEYRALRAFKKHPWFGDKHMEGLALLEEINNATDWFTSRSISVAKDYGVTREVAIATIKKSSKAVFKELIKQ